jgi:hypothetical protein
MYLRSAANIKIARYSSESCPSIKVSTQRQQENAMGPVAADMTMRLLLPTQLKMKETIWQVTLARERLSHNTMSQV